MTYLKKKMGTFRQVVVVSVRKSPTLLVCRAVLGFPAPNSLDTLQAQHNAFPQNKNKTLRLLALVEGKFEGGVSRAALWTCIFTGFQV